MWYIQSLLVAGFLLVPFIKFGKEKFIIPIGVPLYLFALICGRYFFVIDGVSVIKELVNNYLTYCISPKNGLFIGFLYMGLGVVAAKDWDSNLNQFRLKNINLLLVTTTFIFISEIYILTYFPNYIEDSQYYLTQPIFVFYLFLFSAKYYESPSLKPKHDTRTIRNLSISIYLLHAPVQYAFVLIQEITGVHSKFFGNPYSLFFLTLAVTLLICYPIYKKKTKYLYDWLT